MKNILICLLCIAFSMCVKASVDIKELQALTNQMIIAYGKCRMEKSSLARHLEILTAKDKPEGERPSEKEISEAIMATNIYAVTRYLEYMPPSKALPLYFSLLENDQLMDNKTVFYNGTNSNSFFDILSERIYIKMGVDAGGTGCDKTPTAMTLLHTGGFFSRASGALFWYYIGLEYLPTFWEDWYKCWKLEHEREKPRAAVLKRLARNLEYEFGYHVYPFIAEAIKQGDETFQPLIDSLCKYGNYTALGWSLDKPYKFSDPKSFLAWWEENKEDFIIPAHKKITEVKNVYTRQISEDQLGLGCYKAQIKRGKKLDECCKLKERPISNCWYFTMKEGDEKNWR